MKNLKDKAIKIKGKDYVQVKDRVLALSEEGKPYDILTEYTYFPERRMWVVKATLKTEMGVYNGHAQEIESDDYKQVNATSALENAETSAVGRACALAGIGVLDSIASVEELNKASNRSSVASEKQIAMIQGQLEKLGVSVIDYEKKIGRKLSDLTVQQASEAITTLLARVVKMEQDGGLEVPFGNEA